MIKEFMRQNLEIKGMDLSVYSKRKFSLKTAPQIPIETKSLGRCFRRHIGRDTAKAKLEGK